MKTITIDFSNFSSVKIGDKFNVEILDEISDFDGFIIGGANNILISPKPKKLAILDQKFDFIKIENSVLKIGAKTKSAKIYNFAKKHNLANFEFLKNIPGTLGGLLKMNAGLLNYEISQNLLELRTNYGTFSKNELKFSYRKSEIKGIIFEANFKISDGFNQNLSDEISKKRANQPKGASFGSCFKNPQISENFLQKNQNLMKFSNNLSAGKLLELVNLKGFKRNNCGFSEMHANFLINYGGAKFEDAIFLIDTAKKRVFENFGIKLETEVVIL